MKRALVETILATLESCSDPYIPQQIMEALALTRVIAQMRELYKLVKAGDNYLTFSPDQVVLGAAAGAAARVRRATTAQKPKRTSVSQKAAARVRRVSVSAPSSESMTAEEKKEHDAQLHEVLLGLPGVDK